MLKLTAASFTALCPREKPLWATVHLVKMPFLRFDHYFKLGSKAAACPGGLVGTSTTPNEF